MSKPSAQKTFTPLVITVVAVVVLAAAAIVAVGRPAGSHRASAGVDREAVASTPSVSIEPGGRVPAAQVRARLGALPLGFEANLGQNNPQVKYVARGSGYTLFLTGSEAVFSLRAPLATRAVRGEAAGAAEKNDHDQTAAVRMQLVGGNAQAKISAAGELPGSSNYLIGNDRSRWRKGVKRYRAVSYREVYPGVNLAFHGEQRQVEFDFVVAPGAGTSPIALRFSGASRISTDQSGALTLATSAGNFKLHPPVAYQLRNGERQAVDARFVFQADNQIQFALGDYDRSRELVIDPTVTYATYLGGSEEDDGYGIAIDGSGNAYVTGQTKSTDFPTSTGAHAMTNAGAADVFVTKLKPDGSLAYSTYVGGTGNDSGYAVAVDASGDAFVTGQTQSNDFPTTSGVLQSMFGGVQDAFVFELSPSGGALTYSTYLGGSGADVASGIALDGSGNSYVVGYTESTDFPTHNAIQSMLAGVSNGFVSKLNPTGSALVYSTYLGGSNDFATAVAVDSLGNAYVTGATQNRSFPTTTGAFQTSCGTSANCNGGLTDAFVTVFKPDGSGFVYSTFLGGGNADQGNGIAVDAAGEAYVTGGTESNADFPTKSPLQGTFGGGDQDAFVTKLNAAGSALVYSTYLGGNEDDSATGIAVDSGGTAYITGRTSSSNFPTASPTQVNLDGVDDAFVSEINTTGSQLIFSTFLGGALGENTSTAGVGAIGGIAVDSNGADIYVTGNTISTDFPVVAAEQGANAGGIDAFVARYGQPTFTIAATALSPATVSPGASATSTVTVAALNGFSSSVALACTVSPASANAPTCGFSKTSITPGMSSTLTVSTTASTVGGAYTIVVSGTFGGLAHTSVVMLGVSDFTITASALAPAAVDPGSAATSTVTVGALNGFGNPVALTCSVLPATTTPPTCSYDVTPVTPPGVSTLTVVTTSTTTPANYTVTATGTSGGTAHSATLSLTVNGYHIAATTPAAVNAGASGVSTVTLTALSGYNLAVSLTCTVTGTGSPLPACNAASFSTNPVTPTGAGAQTTLTITTTAPTAGTIRRGIRSAMWLPGAGISLIGLCLLAGGMQRKKLPGFLLLSVLLTSLILLPSCGSDSTTTGGSPCTTVPGAPTALAASSTTATGTILNWAASTVDANCTVLGYAVFQDSVQIGTTTTTGLTVTGLSPSTTYSFTVVASDGDGISPASAPLSVTTGAGGTPSGAYAVTITGTDANGLSQSAQVTLTVN